MLSKSGVYVYNASSNRLERLSLKDERSLGGIQAIVKGAPRTLVFVADLAQMGEGSRESKINAASIDVGYISQNACLYCASEGSATGARGSIDRAALGTEIKLRPDPVIILAQSVGYAKP